jgi:hypothetical protein
VTTPATTDPTPATPPPEAAAWAGAKKTALAAAVIGLATLGVLGGVAVAGAEGEKAKEAAVSQVMLSYLTGFVFWASLPLGGLALLMIGYTTKTSWGLLLRRPLEAATRTFPLLILLWVPLAVGVATGAASPYWWSHPHSTPVPEGTTGEPQKALEKGADNKRDLAVAVGKEMIAKTVLDARHQADIAKAHHDERHERLHALYGFLSPMGFVVVGLVLFLIWGYGIWVLNKRGQSIEDDATKARPVLEGLHKFSGVGLIVYAITTTAAASQWAMSTEPSWSSTMFPVIYAVNQFLTCFAFCLALFLLIVSKPPFASVMRPKFQLDMGTLLLAFTLFWSYTSFSQFMLIWIGNLPEEIPFYLKRSHGGWWYVSAGLIALHFALPFLLLLFRDIKLHPKRLRVVAMYLLVICAIDVTWWIEPTTEKHTSFPFWLLSVLPGVLLAPGQAAAAADERDVHAAGGAHPWPPLTTRPAAWPGRATTPAPPPARSAGTSRASIRARSPAGTRRTTTTPRAS